MKPEDAWKNFFETGKIEDYLKYKNIVISQVTTPKGNEINDNQNQWSSVKKQEYR